MKYALEVRFPRGEWNNFRQHSIHETPEEAEEAKRLEESRDRSFGEKTSQYRIIEKED